MSGIKQLILLTQLIYLLQLQGADSCTFGTDCALPCRCSNAPSTGLVTSGGTCNDETGVCSYDCLFQAETDEFIGQHWFGTSCQTGNVALGKSATSNNNGILSAANPLVDGSVATSSCVSVDTGSGDVAAEVNINLGQLHNVTRVKVYIGPSSSDAASMQQLEVLGGDGVCAAAGDNDGPAAGIETLTCSLEQAVSTVTVRKLSSADNPNTLSICEVAVIGHIYNNVDCSKCIEHQCYENLFCEQCYKGWEGVGCQIASQCPDNCDCTSSPFDNICQSCQQWYTDISTDCEDFIDCIYSLTEDDNAPTFTSATTNSITVTFRQHSLAEIASGLEEYYYYTVFYKQSDSADAAYVNGTGLLQHQTRYSTWTVTIDGLSAARNYTFRLAIYKQQNGQIEECQRIGAMTAETLNPAALDQTTAGSTSATDQALTNGYYLFEDKYCSDSTLYYDSSSSLSECMELCSSRDDCEAFSLRYTYKCYLKASCLTVSSSSSYTTYEKVDSTTCRERCYCSAATVGVPCTSCRQWYTQDYYYSCLDHIGCVYTSAGSTPELTSLSNNQVTLYFKQVDLTGIDTDHRKYYFYTIQYKRSSDSADAFVNGTVLLQHDISLNVYNKRFAMVSGLMEEIEYDFRLAVYKRHNNVAELCHTTVAVSGLTSLRSQVTDSAGGASTSTPGSQTGTVEGDSNSTGLLIGVAVCGVIILILVVVLGLLIGVAVCCVIILILVVVLVVGIVCVNRRTKLERRRTKRMQPQPANSGRELPETPQKPAAVQGEYLTITPGSVRANEIYSESKDPGMRYEQLRGQAKPSVQYQNATNS